MRVSFSIILDHLRDCATPVQHSKAIMQREFSWVALATLADDVSVSQSWLHIAEAHEALEFADKHSDAFFICRCERFEVPEELEYLAEQAVFVQSELTAREIYFNLRSYLAGIADWLEEMHLLYERHEDYQKVLESSEPILGNFITLSNSAYRLIARTPGVGIDDPVSVKLMEFGHHAPETIEQFNRLGLPKKWRDDTDFLEVVEDSPICKYPSVSHIFKFKNSYFLHVVMLCNNNPITQGLLDLFGMFVKALEPFITRDWGTRRGFSQPHDELFAELLSKITPQNDALSHRARILGIPLDGGYRLGIVRIPASDAIKTEDAAWRLVEELHMCKVTLFEGDIVIVSMASKGETHQPMFDFLRLTFLSDYEASIGESDFFDSLANLRFAYQQAQAALAYGPLADHTLYSLCLGGDNPSAPTNHYAFADCLLGYLLFARDKDEKLVEYCAERHPLHQIVQNDLANNTSTAKVLLTYLACGQKASRASELLNMHRNSVMYHVNQIEGKYKVSFADPQTCFEYLLIARIMREPE